MKIPTLPFTLTDWDTVPEERYEGDTGYALWRTLNIEDVRAAVYSPDDMWIDPYSAVTGFMRKARSLGAQVVNGRVAALESSGNKMTGVVLADGTKIGGDWIVNTTGAWAPEVCRLAGIEIPVQSLPLMIYYF